MNAVERRLLGMTSEEDRAASERLTPERDLVASTPTGGSHVSTEPASDQRRFRRRKPPKHRA